MSGTLPAITLVCDIPALCTMLETELGRFGAAPERLDMSPTAVDTLRAAPPALLVVVLLARDMAATCLCQTVGQDPGFADTRLLIVQDSGRDIDQRRALALGADAVLPLPLEAASLREAAQRLLALA